MLFVKSKSWRCYLVIEHIPIPPPLPAPPPARLSSECIDPENTEKLVSYDQIIAQNKIKPKPGSDLSLSELLQC